MRLSESRKQVANVRAQFTVLPADITVLVKTDATESKNVYNLLRYIKSSLPVVRKLRRTEFIFRGAFWCIEEVDTEFTT
jgi:hypothetical protein